MLNKAVVSIVALDGRTDDELLALAMDAAEGDRVVLGDARRFAELGLSIERLGDWPDRLRQRGQRAVFVAVDGETAGFLGIEEDDMRDAQLTDDHFSTDIEGLAVAGSPEQLTLADGDVVNIHIAPVTKNLRGSVVRMLAYNGSVPGPTLRVRQGSELLVKVANGGDLETTVHWHGLRLDNRYDGTTMTQPPIPVGGEFTYRLTFPDPGVYWYHPHIREDYGQELGLYGNIVVVPADADYWPPVHREVTMTLDDVLIDDGGIAPFDRAQPTYTAMGRFGNVLLANGEPALSLRALQGEVVRFYITNTANTRVFNIGMPGARIKVVGGDSGRCEREQFVDSVVVAPSERVVVDVRFEQPGRVALEHRTPDQVYALGDTTVGVDRVTPSLDAQFETLRTSVDLAVVRDTMAGELLREPDKTLALVAEMDMGRSTSATDAASAYVCPMHPEVTSALANRCPKCFMKLVPAQLVARAGHGGHDRGEAHADHRHDASNATPPLASVPAGIEWEDDMVDVNRMTNPTNMRWKLIDRITGNEGVSIDWRFRVGDRVKIRLVNEMDSDHPMHHPFHIHGAGRFLILARDGVVESSLVWKDTVLVPTGQIVDILLEVTHPGIWMAHCHIAEHHESGMMLHFRVDE
jgi:FtsP/CotA-like multicopper oxidase with cupredoxin domain